MVRRRKWSGLLVGVVALGAGCQTRPADAEPPRARGTARIRVATWNVQKCESGVDEVIAVLRRLDADVLCLQEVLEPADGSTGVDQTLEIARALDMAKYSHGGGLDGSRVQCLVILSRTPLSEPEPLLAVPHRNYGITALITPNGDPIRIVCVHLAGTYRLDWAHVQVTSRERIRDWQALLQRVERWPEPTILAGDFNTVPGTVELEQLEAKLARALVDPTYPSAAPVLALDHVLHSKSLALKSAQVVGISASDHLPVVVELSVSGVSELRTPN